MSEQEISQEEKSQAQQDYEKGQEFLKESELSQAANSFHNALIGFQQDSDENGIANASDKLGDVCLQNKDYEKALENFGRAYDICSKNNDRFSMFSLEQKKAIVNDMAGNYDVAIKQYVDAVDEHNALRNPQGAVETLERLAGVYLKVKEVEKAADCYRTIASIHKRYKHSSHHDKYMQKAEELLVTG